MSRYAQKAVLENTSIPHGSGGQFAKQNLLGIELNVQLCPEKSCLTIPPSFTGVGSISKKKKS